MHKHTLPFQAQGPFSPLEASERLLALQRWVGWQEGRAMDLPRVPSRCQDTSGCSGVVKHRFGRQEGQGSPVSLPRIIVTTKGGTWPPALPYALCKS